MSKNDILNDLFEIFGVTHRVTTDNVCVFNSLQNPDSAQDDVLYEIADTEPDFFEEATEVGHVE